MDKFIITITRQFGSLGRPIAEELAKELGITYYDRYIVEQAAEKMNFPVSVIDEKEEKAEKLSFFEKMKYPLGNKSSEAFQEYLFETQRQIIVDLVEEKSCIVVGRCADSILKNNKNAIHIYIYAPYIERVRNCIREMNLTEDQAIDLVDEVDQARANYHMKFSGFTPDDRRYKDLMVDSSKMNMDEIKTMLLCIIKEKFQK